MRTFLTTTLGQLRLIGFLEGISYLVLLGIAMPLKYLYDLPQAVRHVGMAHGVLFIAYVGWVLWVANERSWTGKKTFLSLLASLIPFGTFYADAKWFR